jgi:hypothetical protein
MIMDLPKPLSELSIDDRVYRGHITITYEDMASIFDPVVNEVPEVIQSKSSSSRNAGRGSRQVDHSSAELIQ